MTYVISDIHGDLAGLRSVLEQIRLRPEDTLYILGDVMDRLPDGVAILRWLMACPNCRMLLGNHELMMLNYLDEPSERNRWQWFRNGGEVTLKAFLALPEAERRAITVFLRSRPLQAELRIGEWNYLLVHAAPLRWYESYNYKNYDPTTFAVWYRLKGDEPLPEGTRLVFGHTPTPYYQPDQPPRVWRSGPFLGIDCGAATETGRLCCLRLEDGAAFYAN